MNDFTDILFVFLFVTERCGGCSRPVMLGSPAATGPIGGGGGGRTAALWPPPATAGTLIPPFGQNFNSIACTTNVGAAPLTASACISNTTHTSSASAEGT